MIELGDLNMNSKHYIFFGIIIVGISAMLSYKLYKPVMDENSQLLQSDASKIKGKIIIGVDDWIGYYILCSKQMKTMTRNSGYLLGCVNDKANMDERMDKLEKGEYQFSVATVDSYLQTGKNNRYPATIVMVIDESKGGDAIVANKSKISSVNDLKNKNDFKIAYTPSSPSEHLLRRIKHDFEIPHLIKNSLKTDGSEDAVESLKNGKVDVATVWEPSTSKILEDSRFVKIIGTEDMSKVIVDVLLVQRDFSKKNPDVVRMLMSNYFRTLKYYNNQRDELITEIMKVQSVKEEQVNSMLNGVRWINLYENSLKWFGITKGENSEQGLVDTIDATLGIFQLEGVFSHNPLPKSNPFSIINSVFVDELSSKGLTIEDEKIEDVSISRKFKKLTVSQWGALAEVGTLKIRPITFQRGTSILNDEGKEQLDLVVKNLEHYPNYRVFAKGHTGAGDEEANYDLSMNRAEAVKKYLVDKYNIDPERIKFMGFGATKPLPKEFDESDRSYSYRLPRVEISLLKEVF